MSKINFSNHQGKYEVNRGKIYTIILFAIAFFLRILISTYGYNFDVESYSIVSNLVINGKNVYANTERYNYGPIWFSLLGIIKWIQLNLGFSNIQSLHLLIATFLSFVDIAIALILNYLFNNIVSLIFLFSPVSILITGYHSQFDNIAILLALISWLLIKDKNKINNSRWLASSLLMSLSLITKHIMIFFPLWILFWSDLISLRKRVFYVATCYSLFILSFLPFSFAPNSFSGIVNNVFHYRSNLGGSALFIRLVDLIIPYKLINDIFAWVPIFSGIKFLWLLIMVITGIFITRYHPKDVLFYYFISLVVFTTSVADQYLTIPIISCAIFWRRWTSLMYILVTTIFLIRSPFNIGWLEPLKNLSVWLQSIPMDYYHCQIWLFFLLMGLYITINKKKLSQSETDKS